MKTHFVFVPNFPTRMEHMEETKIKEQENRNLFFSN